MGDDHEDLRPVGPEYAQEHPKATCQIQELWPFHRAFLHGELLPKSEILKRRSASARRVFNVETRERRSNQIMNGILTRVGKKDQQRRARMNK